MTIRSSSLKPKNALDKFSGSARANFFKALVFPLIMLGVTVAGLQFYRAGLEGVLTSLIFLFVLLLASLLEKYFPYIPNWSRSWRENAQDRWFFLIIQPAVMIGEVFAAAAGVQIAIYLSIKPGEVWAIASLSFFVQCCIALLISDLPLYLFHRACHRSKGFLWRLHAIHHVPDRLYSLNFARFHPLNVFANSFLTLLPLIALGAPPRIIFMVAITQKTHGVLTHTNFDFRLGPLNRIFSMAELHRWHHVRNIENANGNFGGTLSIWDSLFGTRKLPLASVKSQPIGTMNPNLAQATLWSQLTGVFRSRN